MLRDIRAAPRRTRQLCLYSLRKPKRTWFDVTSRKGRQHTDLANISQPERQTFLRPIRGLSARWNLMWVIFDQIAVRTMSGLPLLATELLTLLLVRFVPYPEVARDRL